MNSTETKNCGYCGNPFQPRHSKSKYCSRRCQWSGKKCDFKLPRKTFDQHVSQFWGKVKKSDGCWLWGGTVEASGFGVYRGRHFRKQAHVMAWELSNGDRPRGMGVHQSCKNQLCVNPGHLELLPLDVSSIVFGSSRTRKQKTRSSKSVSPIFSEQDKDLLRYTYRLTRGGYPISATHRQSSEEGKVRIEIFPHRIVAARAAGRPLVSSEHVDHRNFNKLDCTRENLRIVTAQQNSQHKNISNSTRGTTKIGSKWQAQVRKSGKTFYLGLFDSREEAAAAAQKKRDELGFYKGEQPK